VTRGLWKVMLALVVCAALADETEQKVYSESFKKGATRVTDQTFDVSLTPEHGRQEFKVADSTGKVRYLLRFAPDISPGDTKVIGWFVRLADLHHKIYESVLPTSPDLSKDTTLVWWLDGRQFSKVPLRATRIIKVEQFYCAVQVKDVARLSPGQPYLRQLDLSVQFSNRKP
jgi:hypothetical protein